MDGGHVEPGNGLHESQRGMQELLCRAARETIASDGKSPLYERLSRDSSSRCVGFAAVVESWTTGFRQLDERPVSPGCSPPFHPADLQDNEGMPSAQLSNSDEAQRTNKIVGFQNRLAGKRVDGS